MSAILASELLAFLNWFLFVWLCRLWARPAVRRARDAYDIEMRERCRIMEIQVAVTEAGQAIELADRLLWEER